jgi:GDPmannose 4,6-dehydratase
MPKLYVILRQLDPKTLLRRAAMPLEFAEIAFQAAGLELTPYLRSDKTLLRPSEIRVGGGDPSKARQKLGWSAGTQMPEVAKKLVQACQHYS